MVDRGSDFLAAVANAEQKMSRKPVWRVDQLARQMTADSVDISRYDIHDEEGLRDWLRMAATHARGVYDWKQEGRASTVNSRQHKAALNQAEKALRIILEAGPVVLPSSPEEEAEEPDPIRRYKDAADDADACQGRIEEMLNDLAKMKAALSDRKKAAHDPAAVAAGVTLVGFLGVIEDKRLFWQAIELAWIDAGLPEQRQDGLSHRDALRKYLKRNIKG
jgi:hypothetical protein